MVDEEKEKKVEEEPKESKEISESDRKNKDDMITLTDKIRDNPWVVATVALAIVVVILLVGDFSGGMTGATIGAADADVVQGKVVAFLDAQTDGAATLDSLTLENGFYTALISYQGNQISLYVTADGKNLAQLTSLDDMIAASADSSGSTTSSVPKSDKPVVELFIMSHCPYGTQAEKGMLPVFELLGSKIDANVRFVYYAMHGETEVYEQLNQYCIQKEQSDKYYDYLRCFLEDANGEACLTKVGIDMSKLKSCTDKVDIEFSVTENLQDRSSWLSGNYPLFDIHADLNSAYGVSGSPTLIINGVKSSSSRDPASYLAAVCAAFNEVPSECSETLSGASPSAGFGWGETAASGTDATCG